MAQNTSHAVMAQRVEDADSLDDFPTPPWGTRAFLKHYFEAQDLSELSVWEPACGRGHMAQVLAEYFGAVRASDVFDYGYGEVQDFLIGLSGVKSVDWVITNPPFRLAEDFFERGRQVARKGVALLIIVYYGAENFGPFTLTRDTLDDHFGVPIIKQVEEVNAYYRGRVEQLLAMPAPDADAMLGELGI